MSLPLFGKITIFETLVKRFIGLILINVNLEIRVLYHERDILLCLMMEILCIWVALPILV